MCARLDVRLLFLVTCLCKRSNLATRSWTGSQPAAHPLRVPERHLRHLPYQRAMASLARKSRRAKRREKRNAARNGAGDDAQSIASNATSESTVTNASDGVNEVHGGTPECQAIYKILTSAGTDPEKLPEEILNYVSSAASDKLTTPEDLAGILSSMEIVAAGGDGEDNNAANKTAQSIIDAIRPKEDEASKADDHKKHQYKNLVRNKESEAIAMSALWGMKKQNVNEGMNGWVQNGGATIVDWLAKNSKSGRRRIRLAAKEEEKRKKLLDEHIAYVKMLRRAEVRIVFLVDRFTHIFTKN